MKGNLVPAKGEGGSIYGTLRLHIQDMSVQALSSIFIQRRNVLLVSLTSGTKRFRARVELQKRGRQLIIVVLAKMACFFFYGSSQNNIRLWVTAPDTGASQIVNPVS